MSDETVVGIRPGMRPAPRAEPDPDVVKKLEELLAEAKAGELIGVVTICTYVDDTTAHGNVGIFNRVTVADLFSAMVRLNSIIDGKEGEL